MQVTQSPDLDAYAAMLRKDRNEVHHLFQDLLIGVTQFFRDAKEFEVLEKEIPRLFEGKGPSDQLRVWVLGCATGEEAYSIGILLSEYLKSIDNGPTIQIFATDLDARALGAARAGRYSSAIADHVTPERLARWFVKEGDTYRVAKELREMCIFSPHNLIKDAPFSRIDLLSCRNLLIYLNAELQSKVIPIFHFSLRPGGVLFLGSSENGDTAPEPVRAGRPKESPIPQRWRRRPGSCLNFHWPFGNATTNCRQKRQPLPGGRPASPCRSDGAQTRSPSATHRLTSLSIRSSKSCIFRGVPSASSSRPRAPPISTS